MKFNNSKLSKILLHITVFAFIIIAKPCYAQTQDSTLKEIIRAFLYCEDFTKFTGLPYYGKNHKVYVEFGNNYRKTVQSITDSTIHLIHSDRVWLFKDDWIVIESISVKRNKAVIKAVRWKWLPGPQPLKKGEIYMKRRKGKWIVTGNTLL